MPALRVDGLRLHYYHLHGQGRPVVLLHGFTSSYGGNWGRRGWPRLLAEHGFRVVGLDFPATARATASTTPHERRPSG